MRFLFVRFIGAHRSVRGDELCRELSTQLSDLFIFEKLHRTSPSYIRAISSKYFANATIPPQACCQS